MLLYLTDKRHVLAFAEPVELLSSDHEFEHVAKRRDLCTRATSILVLLAGELAAFLDGTVELEEGLKQNKPICWPGQHDRIRCVQVIEELHCLA